MKTKILSIVILLIGFGLSACSKTAEQPQVGENTDSAPAVPASEVFEHTGPPNIVFILVDDMGYGDVGYNGSEIATPVLDQMASDGMLLDRNYVYPICSPTRAALLTGRNPLHLGVDAPISLKEALPMDVKIMPEYFKDLGYQTFMVGKWHLGVGNTDYWPTSRGFDSHYGFVGGWVDFYTHVSAGGLDWQRDGQSLREEGHTTDLLTAEALRVIESRDQDTPFFLYLAYNAPHSPLQTTPINSGLNDDVEAGDRKVYAEMVTQMDAGVGQVFAKLEAEGVLEDTLIVFSSDNGGSLPWGASNGPLSGGKGETLEGGMRVPGLVLWPGYIEGGRVLEQPIVTHDWLPTLLDAIGGDASVVDNAYGRSMWGAIANGAKVDSNVVVMGGRENKAVFDWPWKLVHLENLAAGTKEDLQLYNVLDDPNEHNDLAAQNPEKLDELLAVLEAMPVVASKRDPGSNSASLFYATGDSKDYEARLAETLPPWAEAAVRGSGE
ncbi:MAG: arylsulfatase [Arenicellaceae bacterium]|nr:arylsulfatase [Arenicellaceae bacterium]